jgi:predicted amino acid dehydrogenase
MFSDIFRLLVFLLDWRSWLRILTLRPTVDILFISTIRSSSDRKKLTGLFNAANDHFGLVRLWIGKICGHIRIINSTYEEVLSPDGFKKAKKQAEKAIEWAEKRGARVVLFASSTKRLFGNNGEEIKEKFPNILFTIGDNGTAMILEDEITSVFKKLKLNSSNCKVGILGAYGFVGEVMVQSFLEKGFTVVGMGTSESRLKKLSSKYSIDCSSTVGDMGELDVVVACTHLGESRLTSDNIDLIRKSGKKLLVFDMAQPPNLDPLEYEKCKDRVIRLDSGDTFSPKLKYVLGPLGCKATGVPKGVTFGCFGEGIVLATLLKKLIHAEDIINMDHFEINLENVKKMRKYYESSRLGFTHQKPRTFCSPVPLTNLSL